MADIIITASDIPLPLVSVVTPSFNQGQFIRQTVESVLGQDYAHLEYWVIDGGSTDNTPNILSEFESDRRFHWLSEADGGQADAIKKGWQKCNGQIITWLNSDDVYLPGALSRVVAAFKAHSDAALVCGSASITNELGEKIGHISAPYLTLDEMLRLQAFLPQPAVFMQATHVDNVGGMNPTLQYAMDYDLFLRLAKSGKFCYIEDYLAEYRLHAQAKTSTAFYHLRKEAAQVAQNFMLNLTVQDRDEIDIKLRLSYAYMVEAYADFRLRNYVGSLKNLFKGRLLYPANVRYIARRALKGSV